MILFKLELKDKLRKIYPMILLLCAILIAFRFTKNAYHIMQIDAIMEVQRMALLGFMVIAFLSIDFFETLQKKNWRELISTIQGGVRIFCAKRFLTLMLFVGIWFLFAALMCFVFIWPYGQMSLDIKINVWKALVLNFALFPMVGILLGMVVNVVFQRFTGYLVFLIFLTVFIGVLQSFSNHLYMASDGMIDLDVLARVFTLTQPNMDWAIDTMYLIPVELYRFLLYFGWMLLFLGILFLKFLPGKKKWVWAIILWIGCGICFSQVVNPGGISNYNSNDGNGTGAGSMQEFMHDEEEYSEKVILTHDVLGYELDVKIRKDLKGTATMEVVPGKEEYLFTLYRGYELKSVTDGAGNDLPYERDRDYITVNPAGTISQIVMEYQGYSGAFFSNNRMAVLPAGFAWYPQSGHRPVYYVNLDGYNTDMSDFNEVDFKVKVDGKHTFYSNLAGTENSFEGQAKACTLMGGQFAETEQDGLRIIYPKYEELLPNYVDEFMENVELMETYLGKDMVKDEELTTLFVLADGFQMATASDSAFDAGDHIVINDLYSPSSGAQGYVRGTILLDGRMGMLWFDMLQEAVGLQDAFRIMAKEEFFTEDEDLLLSWYFQFNMYKTLQSMGDEMEVKHRILEYMQEEEKTVGWREFMQQYYLELEGENQ